MAAIKFPASLRNRVRAAVTALLSVVPAAAPQALAAKSYEPSAEPASSPNRWTWETSFMQYNESDRIAVSEPQLGVRRDFANDRVLTILATVDTISGSTPLGTLPETQNTAPATITSPSGHPINPIIGKIPTSEMTDTRIQLNSTYEKPGSSVSKHLWGGNVSKERDYLSLGGSYTWNRDYNQKNSTLALGLSPEFDRVEPNGGLPQSFGIVNTPAEFEGTVKNKYVLSGLMGWTQIINRKTLMQFNYSPMYEWGYLNDPYKLLSLVNTNGDPIQTLHERRPNSRMEHSFYWLTRYSLRKLDVFSLGLRYFADDWGIRSQTIDFNYRCHYHPRRYFSPHVRYTHQSRADFFRIGLLNTQAVPEHASADYRLSDIDGVTIGLQLGFAMKNGSELVMRADYYTQTGEDRPSEAIGAQRAYDLFPTLHASIIQVSYLFEPSRMFGKSKH